jgi:N-acetylglutamate synthase-like GNAT family acetyltransferase
MPGQIRLATHKDLRFVEHLQKRFTNQIGFIPRAAVENLIDWRLCTIALENGAPAGMLLGRDRLRWNIAIRPITQAAIDFDAQRRHNGLALVSEVQNAARSAGQLALQCCCREGLEANEFWRAAGFEEVCRLDPQSARGRKVICWRKLVLPHVRPAWFLIPPPVSGHKARKTRL